MHSYVIESIQREFCYVNTNLHFMKRQSLKLLPPFISNSRRNQDNKKTNKKIIIRRLTLRKPLVLCSSFHCFYHKTIALFIVGN